MGRRSWSPVVCGALVFAVRGGAPVQSMHQRRLALSREGGAPSLEMFVVVVARNVNALTSQSFTSRNPVRFAQAQRLLIGASERALSGTQNRRFLCGGSSRWG
jgi:hypothetical protein